MNLSRANTPRPLGTPLQRGLRLADAPIEFPSREGWREAPGCVFPNPKAAAP